MSVLDTLEVDPGRIETRGGEADTRPPPSWYTFNWDATKASAEDAFWDVPGRRQETRNAEILTAAAELARLTGKPITEYQIIQPGDPGMVPYVNEPLFWRDLAEARKRRPDALKDFARDRADLDLRLTERFRTGAQDRARRMERGGLLGNLAGGIAGAFTDPINLVTMPFGGGGKTVASNIIREGLLNAGIETLETPLFAAERKQQGRDWTLKEAGWNIALAGLGGSAFAAAGHGIAKGADKAWNALPLDLRGAMVMRATTPDWAMTPEQAAALHVTERVGEIDATNPFQNSYAGLDAHAAKVDKTIADLVRIPEAAPVAPAIDLSAPGAASRAAAGGAASGAARTGGKLHSGIVGYLRAAGIPEPVARGIAAGIDAESRSDHRALNPDSGAMGIGQWLGPRKRELIRRYGSNPSLEQQLEFLVWELRGGDAGGRKVLAQGDEAAALQSYIVDFMRPAAGAETTGDLSRGMAALGRDGEPLDAGDASGESFDLDEELPIVRPEALDAARPLVTAGGRGIAIEQFGPGDIGVDAELMQFKSGGDAFGVTDRLQGVDQWDPIAAGVVTVWEGLDGRRLIADGHQRLGLARRIAAADPAQDIRLTAFVLREADGFTARDARVLTALKNIGEGTGTGTDAAKVFRDVGLDPEVLRRLPPRSALVRDGKALARLSDEAFGAVINDVIPEGHAAAIGHLADDPDTHMALVRILAETDPANRKQAEAIVRQALGDGFVRETQDELFGARDLVRGLYAERAKVLDRTLAELRKLKGAFGVAARNAEALDAAGNRIDVSASEAAAQANAYALEIIDRLALSKGNAVNDLFNRAAGRLAEGEPVSRVVRDVVAEVRALDLEAALRAADGDIAVPGAGRAGEPDIGSRRDGEPYGEDAEDPGSLSAATRDELEAAGQLGFLEDAPALEGFDDPRGKGVAQAADGIWHDIEAMAQTEKAIALDDVILRAEANQTDLASIGDELAAELGIEFKNPGVKKRARIEEKVRLEDYADASELKDITRAAFVIDDPAHADAILASLHARFGEIFDKGWQVLPSGYLDRKLIITFPNGGKGEVQIVPREIWTAKNDGGGNDLYQRARVAGPEEKARLQEEARTLYSAALERWVFDPSSLSGASGNLSAKALPSSGMPSNRALATSAGAGRQVPLDQTQALSAGRSTTTGRSSTSNNSNFMGDAPREGDMGSLSPENSGRQIDEPTFDLDDGKGPRALDDIVRELNDDADAADIIDACMRPMQGGGA